MGIDWSLGKVLGRGWDYISEILLLVKEGMDMIGIIKLAFDLMSCWCFRSYRELQQQLTYLFRKQTKKELLNYLSMFSRNHYALKLKNFVFSRAKFTSLI